MHLVGMCKVLDAIPSAASRFLTAVEPNRKTKSGAWRWSQQAERGTCLPFRSRDLRLSARNHIKVGVENWF